MIAEWRTDFTRGDVIDILSNLRQLDLIEIAYQGFYVDDVELAADYLLSSMTKIQRVGFLNGKPTTIFGIGNSCVNSVVQPITMIGKDGTHRLAPSLMKWLFTSGFQECRDKNIWVLRACCWEHHTYSQRFLRNAKVDTAVIGTVMISGQTFVNFEKSLCV